MTAETILFSSGSIFPLRRYAAMSVEIEQAQQRMEAASKTSPKTSFAEHAEPASVLKQLGPGLVTGAADDDPSGIATYSQAGAQFGFGLLWTLVLTYPLMTAVQLVSARIGRVTDAGLARNMAKILPRWIVMGLVSLLFVANTINIGADLAAMG